MYPLLRTELRASFQQRETYYVHCFCACHAFGHPTTYAVLQVFASCSGTWMNVKKKLSPCGHLLLIFCDNGSCHRPSCESQCLRTPSTTANCLFCREGIVLTSDRDTLDHNCDPVRRHCSWPTSKIQRGSCDSSLLQPW